VRLQLLSPNWGAMLGRCRRVMFRLHRCNWIWLPIVLWVNFSPGLGKPNNQPFNCIRCF